MAVETGRRTKDRPYLVVVDPQVALYRYLEVAQRKGYQTLILALDARACREGELQYRQQVSKDDISHIDTLVQCDTGRAEEILQALRSYSGRVAGLLPGDDPYLPATFAAGRALGFDYARPDDAVCQQLKSAMKLRMAECGVRTPRFRLAKTLAETEATWEAFGRNCMLKMVDYSSSANVYRVTTRAQVHEAWEAILSNRLSVVVPFPLAQEALLEEFVGGRELSAEGYAQDDQIVFLNFCEKVTSENFVVIGHFLPAVLSSDEEASVRRVVEDCVRALGVRNSVFHVEVHLMDGEAYVIEGAARPPGQHIVELIERSRGQDLMDIAIDLAVAKRVKAENAPARQHHAMLALYSETTGTFASVKGLEELESRGGVLRVHLDIRPGDRVEALANFHHRYGFVILEDITAEGVREKAEWLRANVRLVVD